MTTAERMADKVAEFGGSWTFALVLLVWVTGNVAASVWAFDPYPFIFLNLILSMLAAVQGARLLSFGRICSIFPSRIVQPIRYKSLTVNIFVEFVWITAK
ncbi:MAG: DUF1003 domain-containing protein [Agrobacterium vaccinii]